MKKQMRILYAGRVQGVGFRITARQTADSMGVNGWVRNLSDGRVELLLEAEEDVLRAYFKKLNQSFTNYILDYRVEWFPASGKYNDFSIEI